MQKRWLLISGTPWIPLVISGLVVLISGGSPSENSSLGFVGGMVLMLTTLFYLPPQAAIAMLLGVPRSEPHGFEGMVIGAFVYSLIAFIAYYFIMKFKMGQSQS